MSEKERVTVDFDSESYYLDGEYWASWDHYGEDMADEINKLLNKQEERIRELEKDVDYWKQIANQYSNELNIFEHCKKYKTKCKDIYWSSDVE